MLRSMLSTALIKAADNALTTLCINVAACQSVARLSSSTAAATTTAPLLCWQGRLLSSSSSNITQLGITSCNAGLHHSSSNPQCGLTSSSNSRAGATMPTSTSSSWSRQSISSRASRLFSTSSSASSSSSSSSEPDRSKPLAPPWTPTSMLLKRKTYKKRSRFLIQTLEAEQQGRLAQGKEIPPFSAGDILEVQTVVPEADRKVYTYKGVCVARANRGPRSWFKLYNVFPDAGGFVQHFPLYMPDMLSIKVVGRLPKAKRSKLYHLLEDESPKHVYQASVEVTQQQQQ